MYVQNSLNLKLPRAGTAEGSRLPWSAFPRVLNFWRVQLLFYVAVLINSGACRVMAEFDVHE